mmetsp:Transcript_17809/g.30185  ORF Transcript_17809/g.30185 Transcript_17809/m.30185 type:complete len:109 (+) Transcript_17809:416-742(+)
MRLQDKYEALEARSSLLDQKNNALHQDKFAEGMGEDEKVGETIRMKGPTKLDSYDYLQDGERTDGGPLRGDHEVLTTSQELVDREDNQALRANTRIPYASTLQIDASV